MGMGFDIPWVGGQKSISRGFDISCIGGLIYHGYGIQNIMGGVFEIPWDISFKILPSQIYSFGRNLAARVTNV
jgi:hypothetical protein